jgi:hypothetical protein
MKVFISWSGELGQKVAETLNIWLPAVIQTVQPFVSSDTTKGSRWHEVVARELEECNFGIACITRENVYQPWLNFEAGALSKFIQHSHVSPFLVNIKPTDITGPLTQFQSTSYTYADVFKLIKSMNSASELPVGDVPIERLFRAMWPQLKEPIDRAIVETTDVVKQAVPIRTTEEMLTELLNLTRMHQKTLEDIVPPPRSPGSLTTEVDFTEARYLLKRLRETADTAAVPGRPETPSMVQIRALTDLIMKCLAPAIDVK